MMKNYNKYFVSSLKKKRKMCKEKCSICGEYNTDEKGEHKDLNARYMCCDKCQEEIGGFMENMRLFAIGAPYAKFPILPKYLLLFHSPLFRVPNKGYILIQFLSNVLCKLVAHKTKWFKEDILTFRYENDLSPEDIRGFIEFALKTKLIAERKPSSDGKKRYVLKVNRLYEDDFVYNLFPITCDARYEKGTSVARMLWNEFAITYERIYNNPPNF